MHVYIRSSEPWLDKHIKSSVLKYVPDAVFVDAICKIPAEAESTFQYCDGWHLTEHFAVLNSSQKGLINAYPNSDALARKDHLARVIEYWTAKRTESALCNHVPTTVRLTLDYSEYVEDALTAADDLVLYHSLDRNEGHDPFEREWWILKPALIDCGAGIRLFSTIEELAAHLELAANLPCDEDGNDDLISLDDIVQGPGSIGCGAPPIDNGKNGTETKNGATGELAGDNVFSAMRSSLLDSLDVLVTASGKMHQSTKSGELNRKSALGEMQDKVLLIEEDGRIPSAQMREFVAQRYISNVSLLEGRKWHVRAYAVSVGRLKVSLYREMLALLASEKYEAPWKYPSLKSSLTNTSLQEEDEFMGRESMRDFWEVPNDLHAGDWKEDLFQQMCEITAETFRAAAYTMADKFMTMDKCFELFAVDFLVDENAKAWLLEVNEAPAFYQQGIAGPLAIRLVDSTVCLALEHMFGEKYEDEEAHRARGRMVGIVDESRKLGKSNIREILPEDDRRV